MPTSIWDRPCRPTRAVWAENVILHAQNQDKGGRYGNPYEIESCSAPPNMIRQGVRFGTAGPAGPFGQKMCFGASETSRRRTDTGIHMKSKVGQHRQTWLDKRSDSALPALMGRLAPKRVSAPVESDMDHLKSKITRLV